MSDALMTKLELNSRNFGKVRKALSGLTVDKWRLLGGILRTPKLLWGCINSLSGGLCQ